MICRPYQGLICLLVIMPLVGAGCDDSSPQLQETPDSGEPKDNLQNDADQQTPLPPGSTCRCDSNCASIDQHLGICVHGVCMTQASGQCSADGSAIECAPGSRCWDGVCWPDCADDCAGTCDKDGSCAPNEQTGAQCEPECATACGTSEVGGPCQSSGDCRGGFCYQDASGGWVDGYCLNGCSQPGAPCGNGGLCIDGPEDEPLCMQGCEGGCRLGYACRDTQQGDLSFCAPYCEGTAECPDGHVCSGQKCIPGQPCTNSSECNDGKICKDGHCVTDIGDGPGAESVPICSDLPPLECSGSAQHCGELIQFEPPEGSGYTDFPENGETWENQYRSWLRRDLVMLIQYAAATVDCKLGDWDFGNGAPIGLIDMSERDGSIPGTSIGQPGHPINTHTNGEDIDMAYYQVDMPDNRARPVCDHYQGAADAYHCVSEPYLLDPWRTALFIATLAEHPNLRVVGVDGKVGPVVVRALSILCRDGWIAQSVCENGVPLAYEETNNDGGWYLFHHHHFHVSYSAPTD